MYQRILVPTDGSEMSTRAVQTAASLAKLIGAKLQAFSVKEPFPYSAISEMQPTPPQEFYDAQERAAQARLSAAQATARQQAWEAILDHAKASGCDLVVMASHGRRGMAALLLGSAPQKVLTHSSIPVLVVR